MLEGIHSVYHPLAPCRIRNNLYDCCPVGQVLVNNKLSYILELRLIPVSIITNEGCGFSNVFLRSRNQG